MHNPQFLILIFLYPEFLAEEFGKVYVWVGGKDRKHTPYRKLRLDFTMWMSHTSASFR